MSTSSISTILIYLWNRFVFAFLCVHEIVHQTSTTHIVVSSNHSLKTHLTFPPMKTPTQTNVSQPSVWPRQTWSKGSTWTFGTNGHQGAPCSEGLYCGKRGLIARGLCIMRGLWSPLRLLLLTRGYAYYIEPWLYSVFRVRCQALMSWVTWSTIFNIFHYVVLLIHNKQFSGQLSLL